MKIGKSSQPNQKAQAKTTSGNLIILDTSKNELVSILAILVIGFIAYFPHLLKLGFYFNDWHLLLVKVSGTNLVDFFRADRPVLGFYFSIMQNIIGITPLGWHLYALVLRLLGGVLSFFLFKEIWPKKGSLTTSMAILFVIFPGFIEQTNALTYQTHFLVVDIAILSILFTVKAINHTNPRRYLIFTILAIFTELMYLTLLEYFIGMEIFRFVLIGYFFFQQNGNKFNRSWIFNIVKKWWPYLVIIAVFLFWRILIFRGDRLTTDVGTVLQSYGTNTLLQIIQLFGRLAKGFLNILISSWSVPLYNRFGSLQPGDVIINSGITILGILFFVTYIIISSKNEDRASQGVDKKGAISLIIIGTIAELGCLLPIILTGRQVEFSYAFDRYTMPAFIGAILIICGLIESISIHSFRIGIILLLIGISVLTQLNNGTYYKNFWEIQKEYFWQLYWRAPGLKEKTILIFSPQEIYSNAEDEEIYVPANLIYFPEEKVIFIGAEVLNDSTLREIIMGTSENRVYRNIVYYRIFPKSLIASLDNIDSCLHVYDSKQVELAQNVSPQIMVAAEYSNIGQIIPNRQTPQPPESFFGAEPEHAWCYYYQKASLARQKQDWTQVVQLADEAAGKALLPKDVSEWMPFLEGYANQGRQEDVAKIFKAIKTVPVVQNQLCNVLKSHPNGVYSTGNAYQEILKGVCDQ
jgi:hypothetical protein